MNALTALYSQLSNEIQQHSTRVSVCAGIMAKYATSNLQAEYSLSEKELTEAICTGCLYHDIGRLFFPPLVLLSQNDAGNLLEVITHLHPISGRALIEKFSRSCFPNNRYIRVVADIVLYHHERYDGSGYPYALLAKDIPSSAELCAVANKFDKLYGIFGAKKDYGFEFVAEMIKEQSERCFTAESIEWFTAAKDELSAFYLLQDKKAG